MCGIKSRSHVSKIVNKFVAEGKLVPNPKSKRGFRLPGQSLFSIPLKGIIAANNVNPEMVLDHDPDSTIEILSELIPGRLINQGLRT